MNEKMIVFESGIAGVLRRIYIRPSAIEAVGELVFRGEINGSRIYLKSGTYIPVTEKPDEVFNLLNLLNTPE